MKIVSYNIQYSKGKDGVFDLERIVDAVRGADIIGLQEVVRNMPDVPDADQPARIAEMLPELFSTYGSAIDVDVGSVVENGRASSTRFQFGNMLLSRWPIISRRHFLLPHVDIFEELNLYRSVLETVLDVPDGPLRVYVTHLDHLRSATRSKQLEWLVPKLFSIAGEGAGATSDSWKAFPKVPAPSSFVVLGDFNLTPDCDEYELITGKPDFQCGHVVTNEHWVDSWTRCGNNEDNSITWFDESEEFKTGLRLDYGFISPDLANCVTSARIDQNCPASDHQPYWFELNLQKGDF